MGKSTLALNVNKHIFGRFWVSFYIYIYIHTKKRIYG